MKKKRLAIFILLAAVASACMTSCQPEMIDQSGKSDDIVGAVEGSSQPPEKEPLQLLISCVGDVMVHKSQISAQYDAGSDSYDFNNNFIYVKKYIEDSDLAICNLETTFGGKPYAGYPLFSAPDELAPALKKTGFDVALTANNHIMDRGIAGLERTLEVLRENGIASTGVRAETETPRYVIVAVKGVKIGVIAHTYAATSTSGALLLNGSAVPGGAADLINYFRYEYLDEDLEKIKGTVDEVKAAGADIIIAYYHWGDEFQLKSNELQRYIAERTASDMDVDMIFASHPHTLQEIASFTNKKTGRQIPVFYSMGNFISNQRVETLDAPNSKYTETGIIARVRLEYDEDKGVITNVSADAVPIWVDKYKSGGRDEYAVIPLDGDMDQNATLAISGHLSRAQKAREDAAAILKID